MKKLYLTVLILFVSFLFSNISFGQDKKVYLTISNVEDERNFIQSYGELEITALVHGIKVNKQNKIRVLQAQAVDCNNDTLRQKRDYYKDKYKDKNEISFELNNPSRECRTLKSVSGIIQYFNASSSDNSKIKVSDFKTKTHVNLLKKNKDISLLQLDLLKLKKLKNSNPKEFDKELEKIVKEVYVEGFLTYAEFLNNSNETVNYLIREYNQKRNYFLIGGDKTKLKGIILYNKYGKDISSYYYKSSSSRNFANVSVPSDETLDSVSFIEILIETEKSISEIPFEIKDVPLP